MLNSKPASVIVHQDSLGAHWGSYNGFSRQMLNLSSTPNVIGDFVIEMNNPIPSKNTKFADAYLASYNKSERFGEYYALIFKRNLPIRMQAILSLSGGQVPGLITPVIHGVVPISSLDNREHFAIVLPLHNWKSLQDILEDGMVFDEEFIIKRFLPFILGSLNFLHKNAIIHGNINPSNIFINQNDELYLGECYSEITGFSQSALFETVERAEAIPFGKYDGIEKTDYYALGVTIFVMMTGKSLKEAYYKEIIADKLRLGTYGLLIEKEYIKGRLADIVKGLVHDDQNKRWSFLQVESVLRNQSYSFEDFHDDNIISRAIVFNDKEFYSPRALAYELSQYWDLAKEYIQTDKIKRWLQSSNNHTKMLSILDGMKSMMSSARMMGQKHFADDDELLIRTLIVLDPYGPLRANSVVFFKDSIKLLLLSSIVGGQNETIQIVVNTILSGIYDVYDRLGSSYNHTLFSAGLSEVRKAAKTLAKTDLGYGMDRFIYEMVTTLPCQDVVVKKYFCVSHHDVLMALEEQHISFDDISSRKSLVAFLAARMPEGSVDSMIKGLQIFPALYKSKAFQISSYLALAQYHGKIESLPHLLVTVQDELKGLIAQHMHGNTLREQVMQKIDEAAETGSIAALVRAAASVPLLLQDAEGYKNAHNTAKTISYQINFYQQNRYDLNMSTYHKALRTAVNISYIMLILICLKILLQIS